MLLSTMEMIKLGHMEESHWEDTSARRGVVSVIFCIFLHEAPHFCFSWKICFILLVLTPYWFPYPYDKNKTKKDFISFHTDSVQAIDKDQSSSLAPYSKKVVSDWFSLGQYSSWWKSSLSKSKLCYLWVGPKSPLLWAESIYSTEEGEYGLGICQLVILLMDNCCIVDFSIPIERQ